MPTNGMDYYYPRLDKVTQIAKQQVRAKFPKLIEGSSGWSRAVANRVARLR